MRRTVGLLALMLTMTLAACSNPAPNAIPAESGGQTQGSSQTRGEIDKTVPRPRATAPAPVPRGVPDATPVHGKLTFPTAYQGHWGRTASDCDISRPDAPGLMKIGGARLDFHDATATARTLAARDPYRITADLDYKGGGRIWQRREVLTLEVGGTRLARTDASGTHRYEHC